jgi:hypothetical protein
MSRTTEQQNEKWESHKQVVETLQVGMTTSRG